MIARARGLASRRPRLLAGVVVAALVVVLVGGALLARLLQAQDSGEPPLTQWQAIMIQVRDGEVPKDVALEAFALAFKANNDPLLIGDGLIVKVWPVIENAQNPQSALFIESGGLR